MKKLFTNYNFEFDKNERKLITSFCKQSLKQVENDSKFFQEERALRSILSKLSSDDDIVKFTRDERTRLKFHLDQNLNFLKQQITKSWFLKRWLYRSMIKQYDSILENHFK